MHQSVERSSIEGDAMHACTHGQVKHCRQELTKYDFVSAQNGDAMQH